MIEATEEGARLFFLNKESNEFIVSFLKTIFNNYAGKGALFVSFIGMLNKIRVKKACQQVLFDNIFKKCRLIQLMSPIMMDSDNLRQGSGTSEDKLTVLQTLFTFLEDVTSDTFDHGLASDILKIIFKQSGLTENLIFNLSDPKEDDDRVLLCQVALIGNMSFHLRKFQKSKCMIESGTYKLIYLMTSITDTSGATNLEFQHRALVAIRRATSCRVLVLLDAFVAEGLIDEIVKVLDNQDQQQLRDIENKAFGQRTAQERYMRQIQVNCMCIAIQLCYRA